MLASVPLTGGAQPAPDSKPLRVTDLGDGSLFLWSYAKLQACTADKICSVVTLPKRQVRDVRVACLGRAFVLAENTEYSETDGTEFHKSLYLLDARGQVLDSWDMPDGVIDFAVKDGRAYVLTGNDRVLKLEARGTRITLMAAHPREQRVFVDKQGKVVLCRPTQMSEAIHPGEDKRASCSSQAGWTFQGHWFHVEPLACGEWLVEPVVKGASGTKTAQLQVRSLASGEVVSSARLAVDELRCIDGASLYDLVAQRTISLPALKPGRTTTCGGKPVRDVAESQPRQTCLSTRGEVAVLQPKVAKASHP
jgi:hypothetical protein